VVAFERGAVTVGRIAVQLDDEAMLGPEKVGGEPQQGYVGGGDRQTGLADQPEQHPFTVRAGSPGTARLPQNPVDEGHADAVGHAVGGA
jgi:hypothetical protein